MQIDVKHVPTSCIVGDHGKLVKAWLDDHREKIELFFLPPYAPEYNGVIRRIKEAKFPIKKYLVDFDRSKYDAAFSPKFQELETLKFIDNKENIILIGTPGAGKTHYATALGIAACMKGKSVLFSTVPNLIVELKEAMSQNQLSAYRKKFERFSLVVLDGLGYISFDKNSCELLFNLISNRHGKGSIIITTNLIFENW